MKQLEREIAFYESIQSSLARDHHGMFVVIRGESVEGVYESELKAYVSARKKKGPEPFLIRKCVNPGEEFRHTFHSRVA